MKTEMTNSNHSVMACIKFYDKNGKLMKYSRLFSLNRPLADIYAWAEKMGCNEYGTLVSINDIEFFDHTGSSI